MKQLLFIGNTDKSMFLLSYAHTMSSITHSTLIMDITRKQDYIMGYFDGHAVDAFTEVSESIDCVRADSYSEAINTLKNHGHDILNYDFILIDVESKEALRTAPVGIKTFYISDEDNRNIALDVALLNLYLDINQVDFVNHVHFSSPYKLRLDYMNTEMNERVEWGNVNAVIEYDETLTKLQLKTQHESKFKLKHLSKSYREALLAVIFEVDETLPFKEIATALKLSARKIALFKELAGEEYENANA